MERHPLDSVALRVSLLSWFDLEGPSADGGQPLSDLLDELDGWLGRVTDWLCDSYARPVEPVVPATYLMSWYLDAIARTGAFCLQVGGVVPELGHLQVDLHDGLWPVRARLGSGRFWCLPSAPHSAHPDAQVVAGHDDLVRELTEQTRAEAERFHQRFQPEVRIGSRQRWGMVDDHLQTGLLTAAEAVGDRRQGVDDGRLATTGHGQRPHDGPLRRSCCFAFKVDESLLCSRCPRRAA